MAETQPFAVDVSPEIVYPDPVIGDEFKPIDPSNPPLAGLWISWSDSRRYVGRLQSERIYWNRALLRLQRDYEIEKMRSDTLREEYEKVTTPSGRFFERWGTLIGVSLGVIIGVSATVAIINAPKGEHP